MRVGGVIGDDVEQDPQAQLVRLADQRLRLVEVAEHRLDVSVVGHVVAGVGHRRRVPGVDPQRVDAEIGEVGQPSAQARDVAGAVAVAVGEAADVDLVDDRLAPPLGVGTGVGRRAGRHRHAVDARSAELAGMRRDGGQGWLPHGRRSNVVVTGDVDAPAHTGLAQRAEQTHRGDVAHAHHALGQLAASDHAPGQLDAGGVGRKRRVVPHRRGGQAGPCRAARARRSRGRRRRGRPPRSA